MEFLIESGSGGKQMTRGGTDGDGAQDRGSLGDRRCGIGQIGQIAQTGRRTGGNDRYLKAMIPEPLRRGGIDLTGGPCIMNRFAPQQIGRRLPIQK